MSSANERQTGTTTLHLALAWAWVGIPLTLGVVQTIINSLKLSTRPLLRSGPARGLGCGGPHVRFGSKADI